LIKDAAAAAEKGDRGRARSLLLGASQEYPQSEAVWLWLAHLAAAPGDRVHYLRQVLRHHPQSERARAGLARTLLEQGIEAARKGWKTVARERLAELVALDPASESGWLWLASVAPNRGEQKRLLLRVLEINPEHEQARALVQRAELREDAQPAEWQCPICSFRAAERPELCPGCGLVLSLVDPERVLKNSRLNRELVAGAVPDYERRLAGSLDYKARYHLGMAYLNLRKVPEGLEQLRAASQLRPGDEILRSQIEILGLTWARLEASEKSGAAGALPATVLVIDDSPTVHKLVRASLAPAGFQIVTAADGIDGLSRLKELRPVLILLDITMPGMDGYQVCKVIKANPATAGIPVVMLTGREGLIDKVRARMAGSTLYVTKPFTQGSLQKIVLKLLGSGHDTRH
jgi:twitching motility two-component system response regulator PilG